MIHADRPSPPPLSTILILGTSLGLIAGLLIGAGLGGLSAPPPPAAVPAAGEPLVQVLVTIPPWPTPERTPTPIPYPTYQPVPTSTPWPHYDPRYATPGRLYLVPPPPPPTPSPYPACRLDLPAGTRCIAVAATATVEPQAGRR